MKIQGPSGPASPGKPVGTGISRAIDAATPPARPAEDRVEVSHDARLVASLAEAAGRLPELRAERVDFWRRSGLSFEPRVTARAILEFERDRF
jgi:hypothetical protein